MMAELALQHRVVSFIYSSAMRLGAKYETDTYLKFSSKAKVNIEQHVKDAGSRGLDWT